MKNLELNEIFKVALDEMSFKFSGPTFSKKCNELCYPKFYSNPHKYAEFADKIKIKRSNFLKSNCKKLSGMTYEKIVEETKLICNERTCIEYLLSTGNYRIQYKEEIRTEIWHEL